MSDRTIKHLIALALAGLLSIPALSLASEATRSSKSISYTRLAEPDKTSRDTQLKQAEADIQAPLVKSGYRPESGPVALHITEVNASHANDYTIYDASTYLISDFDGDGFYHRFSTVIDADTVFNTAYVYARLYLSYEGGPWNHYATSDNYHINGDSSLDSFVIETELAEGFVPGYYDVRIELYDADHDEWLISTGPYDMALLSALPLEDSYYDDMYVEYNYPVETEVVIAGQGSLSAWLAMIPMLLMFARRRYARVAPAKNRSGC